MTFQLDNYLLKSKIITEEQLEKALAEKARTRIPTLDALEYLKIIDKKTVVAELEKHFKAKYVELASRALTPEIVRMVPETVMKRYMVIALDLNREKGVLSVAMTDPFDVMAIDAVHLATGYEVEPFLTTEDEYRSNFEKYYLQIFAEKVIGEVQVEAPEELLKEDLFKKISDDNREALVIRLFDTILTQAVRSRATDIHIEPQEKDLLIRFRIDGMLSTVQVLPRAVQLVLITRIKVLAEMDISESRLPQDGQIRVHSHGHNLDLRVSCMHGLYGEKIAIRVLEKSSFAIGLSQLGMLPEIQSRYEDYIFKPNGMVIVCGPNGSGKSTTLYSTLSRIRSPEKNILTLEDPIEYEILSGSTREGGITQVQINPKIGLTFAAGLRTFLRQDPDIIMVGEIRDRETAEIAITASTIGRLVFSTLHTADTIGTVTRLLNMGIEPYMVGHALICIISQRLLRALCPYCKQPFEVPDTLLDRLGVKDKVTTLYRNVGCSKCDNKGYLGRIGVFELLPISETMHSLILNRGTEDEMRATARKEGMKTLSENAIALVLNGTTTVSEMMRVLPMATQ